MAAQVVCPICGDWDRWEKNEQGEVVCDCQTCECGSSEGDPHEAGCHWGD